MVKVRVPATSANLGPGFDTLGLALALYVQVELDWSGDNIIEFTGEGAREIAERPEYNLAWQAVNRVLEVTGNNAPVQMSIHNDIPVGRGLGSSAAAIVAGLVSANQLLGKPLAEEKILALAVEMEGHPDNVVPALKGGLTTAMQYNDQVYYQKVHLPAEMSVVVVVPEFELSTEIARAVLPEQIDLQVTIGNLQRACFLLASLHNGDFSNIQKAMDDQIYQPLRKQFIPGFDQVLNAAYDHGAIGAALSGAGPSIIAFCRINEQERVAQAMQTAFLDAGVVSKAWHLQIDDKGAEMLLDQ
jgi:homoserine kinase